MVAAALSEELEALGIGECRGSEAFAREGEKDGGSESMSGMSRRRRRGIKMCFFRRCESCLYRRKNIQ